jgi:hypothetical protein
MLPANADAEFVLGEERREGSVFMPGCRKRWDTPLPSKAKGVEQILGLHEGVHPIGVKTQVRKVGHTCVLLEC